MYAFVIKDIVNEDIKDYTRISQDALAKIRNENKFTTDWYINMIRTNQIDIGESEIELLTKYGGGNCVGLSLLVQKELEKEGIKSSRVVSTCPERIYMKGQKYNSHCACGFYTKNHIYIIDIGFLFTTPIIIDRRTQKGMGIWKGDKTFGKNIKVHAELTKHYSYDNVDVIKCNDNTGDSWYYILAEPCNPHESISIPHAEVCINNNRNIIINNLSMK